MINFSTLQGVTIPEGVVTQIADASGRVLWKLQQKNEPVVLEVKKITSNTYANSTTYENEKFVLLSITPKSANSRVKITYGGMEKLLTFTYVFAQSVYFGTFKGVSDEVETPDSGTLTIEGDCDGFAVGFFNTAKSATGRCNCITAVTSWGSVTMIPANGFYNCLYLGDLIIPEGVTSLGSSAFDHCSGLNSVVIPKSITSIGNYAFRGISTLTSTPTATICSDTPPTLGELVFYSDYGHWNIIVPAGSSDTYKAAEGWSEYADYITEASA